MGIDVSKSTEVGESLVAVVTVYSRSTVAMSALALMHHAEEGDTIKLSSLNIGRGSVVMAGLGTG